MVLFESLSVKFSWFQYGFCRLVVKIRIIFKIRAIDHFNYEIINKASTVLNQHNRKFIAISLMRSFLMRFIRDLLLKPKKIATAIFQWILFILWRVKKRTTFLVLRVIPNRFLRLKLQFHLTWLNQMNKNGINNWEHWFENNDFN